MASPTTKRNPTKFARDDHKKKYVHLLSDKKASFNRRSEKEKNTPMASRNKCLFGKTWKTMYHVVSLKNNRIVCTTISNDFHRSVEKTDSRAKQN